MDLGKHLRRLLVLKTKVDYDSDDVPLIAASKAVDRALACLALAQRVRAASQ